MKKKIFFSLGLLVFGLASFVTLTSTASSVGRSPELVDTTAVTIADAKRMFGADMIGPEAYAAFGVALDSVSIEPLRFTQTQCKNAMDQGMMLVYFTDSLGGVPLTMHEMHRLLGGFSTDTLPLFFTDMRRAINEKQSFYMQEVPRKGWRFVSSMNITGSSNQNYLEQTQMLVSYVGSSSILFSGTRNSYDRFRMAADTFYNLEKPKIASLLPAKKKELPDTAKLRDASARLAVLPINVSCRETAVELVCRMILCLQQNKVRLLPEAHAYTSSRASDGTFVCVGPFMLDGINFDFVYPNEKRPFLGTTASIGEEF